MPISKPAVPAAAAAGAIVVHNTSRLLDQNRKTAEDEHAQHRVIRSVADHQYRGAAE